MKPSHTVNDWAVALLLAAFSCVCMHGCAKWVTQKPLATAQVEVPVDATVGVRTSVDTDTNLTVAPGRDVNVGGGNDSVALWLAIVALGLGPASYPVLRKARLWRESRKRNGDHTL